MMARWDAGGTEMIRSLSDSAIPLPHDYDSILSLERKRPFHHLRNVDINDDHHILREWKRPRIYPRNSRHAATQFGHQSVPSFFIIKEAARSAQTNNFSCYDGDHTAHNSSIRHFRYENVSAHLETPCLDLKVRDEEGPTFVDRLLETNNNVSHDKAAKRVEDDMVGYRRRTWLFRHERILKGLISPKSLRAEFEIDDEALEGIFFAVNEIFFGGILSRRVTWTWEHLPTNLIGTTAWREEPDGDGYQTRIFLSRQILKNKKYNRRLLIATFIHELIHSYLFVFCGYHPDDCGGHTSGFKRIANLINNWVGEENLLQLHKMEAELSDFEIETTNPSPQEHGCSGCQVQWLPDGTLGYIVLPPVLRLRG